MYVCVCNRITDRQLAACWAEEHPDLAALVKRLGLDDERDCGRCAEDPAALLKAAGCSSAPAGKSAELAGAAR